VNPPTMTETAAVATAGSVPVPRSALEQVRARGRVRGVVGMLGPAFVAAVAYIDPGNFATNIAGGAKYGYMLLWVIVAANLMAMLVQYLSAKTGIATGKNLPELCREHFKRPVTFGLWLQAEAIAIATDLAEFVGAAIALNLLFGVPPFVAGLMTAVVAFAILELQTRGHRKFELAIAGFLGIVFLGFMYDLLQVGVDTREFVDGLVPTFDGTDSMSIADEWSDAQRAQLAGLDAALRSSRLRAVEGRRTMSSMGMACLFLAHAKYIKRGARVKLCSVDRKIKALFALVKLTLIYGDDLHDSEDEALASFRRILSKAEAHSAAG